MSQQHSMASAEQTASAAALREKVEVLGKVCMALLTYFIAQVL